MIRLALVGCGGISASHAQRFHALQDRMKVVAAVDINEELARKAAATIGAPKAETDFRKVLPEVDAVLLALPHHMHHPVGMECLAAGLHVLMEKPLANTEQQCLELIDASRRNDAILMVAYNMRYHPLMQRMKEIIDDKTYGDPIQFSIWTEQFTKYPEGHWALSADKLGGGQFFSHGCHYVDLLLWFLGEPIRGTHIGTRAGTPWMEKEGTSNVSIEFENTTLGYHMGTWGARGTRLRYSMHFHFTDGMVEFTPMRESLLLHRGALEEEWGKEHVLMQTDSGKHMEREMAHFLDCIEQRRRPETNAEDSLQGLRVIWKLYEAEQQGVVADLRGLGFSNTMKR